eukprot:g1389.t1
MFLNRIPYLMRLLFTGFDLCFMIFLISLKYISLTITYDFKATYATYFLVGIWPFQVMAFTIEASSANFEMDYRLIIYTLFVIGEMFWFMFSVNGIYRYPKHYALVLPPLTSNSSSPYLIDMFSLHMNDCNGTNGTNYTSSNNYSSSINLTQSPCNSSNMDSIQKFTVTNTTLYQDGSIVFSLLNLIDLCTFVLLLWEIKMLFVVYFFENDCALIYFNAHTKLVKSRDLQNLSSYEVMKRGKVMPLSKKSPGKRGSWNPTPYQAETIRKKLTGAKEKDLDKNELMVIKEKTPNSNNDSEVNKIHVTREEGIYDCSHAKVTVDESSYLACIGLKSTDPVLCFLPARGYTVEAGVHNLVMHKMNLWKNIETTTWIFNLMDSFGTIISWLSVTANILSLCVLSGVLPSPVGYTMIMLWVDIFTKILNINPIMLYKLLTFYSFWYFLGLHLLIIPLIVLSSNNGMTSFIVVTQVLLLIVLLLFRDAQLSYATLSNHTSRHYMRTFYIGSFELITEPEAVCVDGSNFSFYLRQGTNRSTNWAFFMQGGGECWDADSCREQCTSQGFTSCGLGLDKGCGFGGVCSKEEWDVILATSDQSMLSTKPSENPTMFNWNKVYLPFCSQDQWGGQNTEESIPGYQFSGHLIFKAVIDILSERYNLQNAKNVVLSGTSSGGVGVFLHVDYLQNRLSPATNVVALPIAGFFGLDYPYVGPNASKPQLATFTKEFLNRVVNVWQAFLPSSCTSRLTDVEEERSLCFFANFSAPFIKAPIFIVQAQSDCVQLLLNNHFPYPTAMSLDIKKSNAFGNSTYLDNVWSIEKVQDLTTALRNQYHLSSATASYLSEWKNNQSVGLYRALKSGDGLFNPACFIHANFGQKPKMEGMSYLEAFDKWFRSNKTVPVRLVDDCQNTTLCRTTCPVCIFS